MAALGLHQKAWVDGGNSKLLEASCQRLISKTLKK